jgi:26S proteasome regulatory subunit N7
MAPFYGLVTSSGALAADSALLESMEQANVEELKKLDERLAEAEKTEGESEISDALKARANHLTRIGDKVSSCSEIPMGLANTLCRSVL